MTTYYPPTGFHFRVDFTPLSQGSKDVRFQEVSGLSMALGIEELSEGGENRFVHRLPAIAKYENLVLRRGLLTDSVLIDWIKGAIEQFDFAPTMVNVTLLNENHEPLADTYCFMDVWPVKWSVSDFKAQESALAIETLELCYSRFTKIRL